MNKADSERLAAKLEKENKKPAPKIERADLAVINVCSVRQSAIDRVKSKIKQIRKTNPRTKIILTGCILDQDKKKFKKQVDQIWPIADLKCQPKRKIEKQAYLPIMNGCDNFCSYCAVPYTRGRETSQPAQAIIKQAKDLIKNNYQEIILLGQNVNSYQSGRINFPQLLKKIAGLKGNFQVSFLTSHPKDMSDELIQTIAQSDKISKSIHLPLQSGDNQILKKMNRGYRAGDYQKLIKKIRKAIPRAKISTDLIVGFPGETKKQFQNTLNLVKKIGFAEAFVAAYSPRSGTAAAKFNDDVPSQEKKRRKRILLNLFPKQYKSKKITKSYPQNKLIVILGPTATGKSELAIKLARRFKGEIVSADSRQIYQGMDIGAAKINKEQARAVPHYLLDIVEPNQNFSLAQYQKKAVKTIKQIQKNNKLPFLTGGAGLYIQAVVNNLQIPKVKPDKKLRDELEKLTNQKLCQKLKKLDPEALRKIDLKNRRRLIRALEVCLSAGRPFSEQKQKDKPLFNALQIGLAPDYQNLDKKISQRTEKMIKQGLVQEVKNLLKKYPADLPALNSIGYQEIIQYLNNQISLSQAKALINLHTRQYAKRQMTWFRKDKTIHWVKNRQQAERLIKKFLEKKAVDSTA